MSDKLEAELKEIKQEMLDCLSKISSGQYFDPEDIIARYFDIKIERSKEPISLRKEFRQVYSSLLADGGLIAEGSLVDDFIGSVIEEATCRAYQDVFRAIGLPDIERFHAFLFMDELKRSRNKADTFEYFKRSFIEYLLEIMQ